MIVFFLLAAFVVFCGFMAVKAAGTARSISRMHRAMRALAEQPQWEVRHAFTERSGRHFAHFPWVDAEPRTILTASDGTGPEAVLLIKNHGRSVRPWLTVIFGLPQPVRGFRLERAWSAAALGLAVPAPGPSLPVSEEPGTLSARLAESGLVGQLVEAGAPAVSVTADEVCFLYQPIPQGAVLAGHLDLLTALLPRLAALAGPAAADGPSAGAR